ncbi:hypothetical protein KAI54_02400 [Candidatus Gracilibacteria bacterium]|nr:hypothetical protein [Candidatus Gracilibacteria bacterium]
MKRKIVGLKIEEEISRYQKFTVGVLGGEEKIPKVNVRKYAKYILREGTKEEKRELLGCLKVGLVVEAGKPYFNKIFSCSGSYL